MNKELNIFDRIYKNFKDYNRDDRLAKWTPRKNRIPYYFSCLENRECYEELFESFGIDKISDGINCEHFHQYSKWDEFNSVIEKVENLVNKSNNIALEDLAIERVCKIYGKKYGDKIIPPIFYKFGLILDYLIDLYSKNTYPKTILEIGAGYGGLAHLIMNKFSNTKYIILDLEPTVSVASYFLHKMNKKIMLPNEFVSMEHFESSDKDCLFLHPEQINKISDKSINLCINVDSLFEMPEDVILNYLSHINRITIDYFYSNNRANISEQLKAYKEYDKLYNDCEYETDNSIHLQPTTMREYEIMFQLTLTGEVHENRQYEGYKSELFKFKTNKSEYEFINIDDLKNEFYQNTPFPHILLKNWFPKNLLEDVLSDIERTEYEYWKFCTVGNCFDKFGKSTVQLTDYLVSAEWTNFLSELTGIDDLRSDKSWHSAGINFEPRGSHLEPHTDFNKNGNLGWRRVNMLLFLSKGWKDEWGGHNELGHINEKNQYVADKKYLPEFNHLIIFNTSDISYHGFDLVKCDEDNARIVISCYYYSDEKGNHSKEQHTTNYVGWDKERNTNIEYDQRRGTGWKELK